MKQARARLLWIGLGLAGAIALCLPATVAVAQITTVPAGPIYGASDARNKCKAACWRGHMTWSGTWRAAHGGPNSECDCLGGAGSAGGGSCSAPAIKQCRGCSISCAPGRTAKCVAGSVGIHTGAYDTVCGQKARCECR